MTKDSVRRRDEVLKIIVTEYIATANPVASEAILRHHRLGVSPATIRNDMAFLEDEGYITRPYTSSGSVPLDKAYRFYVENLAESVNLPVDEQKQIRQALGNAGDEYDMLLRVAANIIAQLLGNVAIVTYPRSSRSRFKHMELIWVDDYVALLILILGNAILIRRTLSFNEAVKLSDLQAIVGKFNREYQGKTRNQIKNKKLELSALEKKIIQVVDESMSGEDEMQYDKSYLEGLRLMLGQPEFIQRERMMEILEFIEGKGWLKHVINWQMNSEGVKILIGEESRESSLREFSLILSKYGIPDQADGTLGVIGPKRMDYPKAISAVNYVSNQLSALVARVSFKE